MKNIGSKTINVLLSLLLGGGILYWMYRDFDFHQVSQVLVHEMRWEWMLLSFPFGIMAQVLRGWRWKQTLEPAGEKARRKTLVDAVFISYATSLLIPRIGELVRCGVLKRCDGVSFPKALGTVVTERAIDTLVVLVITACTLLWQMSLFGTFFERTGVNLNYLLHGFSITGWMVTALCIAMIGLLAWRLYHRLYIYNKVRETINGIWQGVVSLKNVSNVPLFIAFTLGIWLCYFLHYYLTFFCFDATKDLGMSCALVTFIVGSIAVIVPTPNGAGPWHFAIKTMLILYGVAENEALFFVLIVHGVQTLLVVLLGIFGGVRSLILSSSTEEDIHPNPKSQTSNFK
ncbi:MAG: flippase-like domain-containing protein [Prevotella sp.]|nr:flippase-like domain-containing protein [Prevotella sp.]